MENVGVINCKEDISETYKISFCPMVGVSKWIVEGKNYFKICWKKPRFLLSFCLLKMSTGKVFILVNSDGNGGDYACVGTGGIWEIYTFLSIFL